MKGKIFYAAILIILILSLNDIFPQYKLNISDYGIGGCPSQNCEYLLENTVGQNIIPSYCNSRYKNINGSGCRNNYLLVYVEDKSNKTSDKFIVQENYPNPFNPTATMKYSIPDLETVHQLADFHSLRLSVYDMLGREVAILVDGEHKSCGFENLRDSLNISTKIYFYNISEKGSVKTKKLLLMK